ncbi:WcbI family polysaccharide biosynthesis putative acetyltransferase [Yoonia sp.]|uniref:WcbI family polysaccharide biosynthesis putative acetyltransferase n=1 Tax=Yoonia sp. TaxID=2212373 RepID=UPI001A0CEBD7|nr:WcbI family polysaccharide biosynthesis putative acetyltransferase [Yoonia sp.]MBE0413045.1 hypothetical protein [Yoonia sp.]
MKVFILGNCQANAMRGLCREMFPNVDVSFLSITPFWGAFDEEKARDLLAGADLIICQAITNPDATFNVDDIRRSTHGEIVFIPYVYLDGIASLEIVASKGKSVIRGMQELMHDQEARKPIRIFEDYCSGRIDMKSEQRIFSSLEKMAAKESAHCSIVISDYLAETWRKQPTLYGINHPTQHVIFEMFRRICERVGWKYDPNHKNDPIVWGRRALPSGTRSLTPFDAKRLRLGYQADPHWYGQAYKLVNLAVKACDTGRA